MGNKTKAYEKWPFVSIAKDALKFKLINAFSRIMAFTAVIVNFKNAIEQRLMLQKLRKASDSYIIGMFTEKYVNKKPFLI